MSVQQRKNADRVCVVVLGDIGRSPRMQYQSMSLADEGFDVDVVAYGGSTPCQCLLEKSNISLHLMSSPPDWISYFPKMAGYALKAFWQFMVLLFTMLRLQKPTAVLLQNPPAIPSLAVVWCFCCLKSSKMIVDWHNYGFTIMSLSLGLGHPLVRISKWFEVFFGRKAHASLCVTHAMKEDLKTNWGINATVLYDRPPDIFQPLDVAAKHDLFKKLCLEYPCFCSKDLPDCTAFTKETVNGIEYRKIRPALLVSSTSWTEDEDFSILLEALQVYDNSLQNSTQYGLPKIVCAITGKGPLKSHYAEIISAMEFQNVEFCMPWLTSEEYPKLIASADLGVCLHKSSSGLDLPMKVVDMLGCGLPVLAYDYKCLSELIRHGVNGMVFREPAELKHNLQVLLSGFPEHSNELKAMLSNKKKFNEVRWNDSGNSERWHDNWKRNALQLFKN